RKELSGSDKLLRGPECLDLTGRAISVEDLNSLPGHLKVKITGSTRPAVDQDGFVNGDRLKGKRIEAVEFNQLPARLRKSLSGQEELLFEGERLADLSGANISAETFNKLPDTVRARLRERDRQVDATNVLMMMADGELDAEGSPLKFLIAEPSLEMQLDILIEKSAARKRASEADLSYINHNLDWRMLELQRNVNQSLGLKRAIDVGSLLELRKDTARNLQTFGVSRFPLTAAFPGGTVFSDDLTVLFDLLKNDIPTLNAHDVNAGEQDKVIQNVKDRQRRQAERAEEASKSALYFDRLSLSREVGRYSQLVGKGERMEADKLAIALYGRYGDALKTHAPRIHQELTGKGEGSLFGRMHRAGFTQFKQLPELPEAGSTKGPEQALKLLGQLGMPSRSREYADRQALTQRALTGIDQAPSLRQLQETVKAIQNRMTLLTVEATASGTRHQDLIDDAKENIRALKDILIRVKEEDVREAQEIRESLKRALSRKGEGEIVNEETRKAIEDRIKTIGSMLQLVDKNEKLDVGDKLSDMQARFSNLKRFLSKEHTVAGVIGLTEESYQQGDKTKLDQFGPFPESTSDPEKLGLLVREYKELGLLIAQTKKSGRLRMEELFEAVDKDTFTADTLAKWIATDGTVLAATIVISAASMAATFGGTSPLTAAAIGAVVSTGTSEGIREVQYRAGMRDEGALFGDYARGKMIEEIDGTKRNMNVVWDVGVPLGTDMGLSTISGYLGSELGGALGSKLFQLHAVRNPAVNESLRAGNRQVARLMSESTQQVHGAIKPSLLEFGKIFVRELMTQNGFTIADHLSRGGIELGAEKLGLNVDLNNAIVGTALNLVLSAAHRGISLKMNLNKALHAEGRQTTISRANREIRYTVENPIQESKFIDALKASGGTISTTDSGFILKVGSARIDFVREPAGATRTKDEVPMQPGRSDLDWINRIEQPTRRAAL
ncbi:MAG: hypothetical protein K2Z81_05805, partial [Cyanobacteria bacterium]|nr:hypothetical protein [Cyanobacteriota bacterium]